LEKLDSWVFVEWSAANDFVQDVNYPTNMLYAAALAAAGRLYAVNEWTREAGAIHRKIREHSNDRLFFSDRAVRTDGRLEVQDDVTEVCQYFAFYFGTATPQTHVRLWHELLHRFGPQRQDKNLYPDVHQANAFIGNYLRLELLSSYGQIDQLAREMKQYFVYMAEKTGTLWENVNATASCNHGFASHVVHVLYRDILGVYNIDPRTRIVELRFSVLSLEACEGQIPVGDDVVRLAWRKENGKMMYNLTLPVGYSYHLTNSSEMEAIRVQ
jgi:alpha-L-rhamnosidase